MSAEKNTSVCVGSGYKFFGVLVLEGCPTPYDNPYYNGDNGGNENPIVNPENEEESGQTTEQDEDVIVELEEYNSYGVFELSKSSFYDNYSDCALKVYYKGTMFNVNNVCEEDGWLKINDTDYLFKVGTDYANNRLAFKGIYPSKVSINLTKGLMIVE